MLHPCKALVPDADTAAGAALEADTVNRDRHIVCQALDADWIGFGLELLRKGLIRPPPDAPAPAASTAR